jgi:hypothetical protein
MKELLIILTAIVVITGLVIGIGMSSPEIDATGQFALGGSFGLQMIIILVVLFTLVSVGYKFISEF